MMELNGAAFPHQPAPIINFFNIQNMKNTIFISLLLISAFAPAQVAVGKTEITNSSVSLEFGDYDTNGKGLILPWVTNKDNVTNAVEGTVVYDLNDHILRYKNGTSTWVDLTKNETATVDGVSKDTTGEADTTLQDNLTDQPNAKVAIGTNGNTDTTSGILVLTDTDKAMILPKVPKPYENIVNPEPGTIVYDTTNKMVAVYNGTVWSFWMPQ